MLKIKFNIIALIIFVTSSIATANAGQMGIGVGPTFGTLGFGIEGRAKIYNGIYARAGVNILGGKGQDVVIDEIEFTPKVDFINIPVMVDFHPFSNSGFRVSAGLSYSNNEVSFKSKKNRTSNRLVEYGNHYYSLDRLGEITHKVQFGNGISPVITIGYDNSGMTSSMFSFNCEVGAIYVGKAKVKSSITGPLKDDADFMRGFNEARDAAQQEANKMSVYPVLSLGFKVNF